MEEKKTRILFEQIGEERMKTEVEGRLGDLVAVLLTGIAKMFDDPFERMLFKTGIKQVYDHWSEEEAAE